MKDKAEQHFRIDCGPIFLPRWEPFMLIVLMCEQGIGFQRLNTEPETFESDFWHTEPPLAGPGQVT